MSERAVIRRGVVEALANFVGAAATVDARAWLGSAPEGGAGAEGRVLTGVGLALLVGVPLLAAGTLVQLLA